MSAIEDRYQIDLSETRFSAVNTVGDLERMLRGEATPTAGYHYPSWVLRWPVTWLRLLTNYLLLRPAIVLLGWPRIIGREHLRGSERAAAGSFQSCGRRRRRIHPYGVACTLPPSAGHRHWRRGSGSVADSAARPKLLLANLRSHAVDSWSLATEFISAPARSRFPAKLRVRGRGCGSWLQCARLPGRPAYYRWKDEFVSLRDRAAGGQSRSSGSADAD